MERLKKIFFFIYALLAFQLWSGASIFGDKINNSLELSKRMFEEQVDTLLRSMTLPEKIGQMMMVGFKGPTIDEELQTLVNKYHVGGVILFSRNVKDPYHVVSLTSHLQKKKKSLIPLFIAVDQEGGSVSRIQKGVVVLPSPMALGATRNSKLAFLAGKMTGLDLSSLGINMNLAPVLDVNRTSANNAIGVRSFGEDPELVSQLGVWYIEGLQTSGVVATAKHFPGHGNTLQDSHYKLPIVEEKWNILADRDWKPFRKAIESGLDAIMTAHVNVKSIDPNEIPATLSYNILTTILRDQLHFNGVVITDDLEMKAIENLYRIDEAALKSILAGADIVMVGWTSQKKIEVFQRLLRAAHEGVLTTERIDESVRRILKLKLKRGLFDKKERQRSKVAQFLRHPFHERLAETIAEQSVTLVTNKNHILPLGERGKGKILLLTPFPAFEQELRFRYPNLQSYHLPSSLTAELQNNILKRVSKNSSSARVIIIAILNRSQVSLAQKIIKRTQRPVVVISFASPYFLSLFPEVDGYLCAYSYQPATIEAVANILVGVTSPEGSLPVSISLKYPYGHQESYPPPMPI